MDTCRASLTKYFGEWVYLASRRPSVALSWGKSMPSLGGAAFASGVRAGTGCWWKEGLRCLSSVSAPWQMLIGRITSSSSHFNWVCPVSVGILWMLMSTWGSVGVLVSRNVSFWCVSPVQWRLSIQTDDDSQYLLLYEIYQDEEMPLMLSWQGLAARKQLPNNVALVRTEIGELGMKERWARVCICWLPIIQRDPNNPPTPKSDKVQLCFKLSTFF